MFTLKSGLLLPVILAIARAGVENHSARIRCDHFPTSRVDGSEWYHRFSQMKPKSRDHIEHTSSELLVQIDARSRVGLQQQIYSSIRRAILDGVLRSGTRLPSSRALADDLEVSRTTTLLAYDQLQSEGYLTPRHGSGTFVASELPDDRLRLVLPHRRPRPAHPPLSRRGLRWPRHRLLQTGSPVRQERSASVCRRSICFRSGSGRSCRRGGCAL